MTSEPEGLYGFHDPGGEGLFGPERGWIAFTHELGSNPYDTTGFDYRPWDEAGIGCIGRLNYGYKPNGTIPPLNKRANGAARIGQFVANSEGCSRWLIGNEPNHKQERPGDVPILPDEYVDYFILCAQTIRGVPGHELDEIIPAPVAPWNVQTEGWPWAIYWRRALTHLLGLGETPRALALHIYSRGASPEAITATQLMDPPYEQWYNGFQHYRQLLQIVPEALRTAPIYITEFNVLPGWEDQDTGLLVAAYQEIAAWNEEHPEQVIRVLDLFRWPEVAGQEQWAIETRPELQADFRNAVQYHFTWKTAEPPTPEPPPANGETEMEVIFREDFETGDFRPYGDAPLLVPVGWDVDWVPGEKPGPVRPEVQPEDAERGDKGIHSGRYGVKLAHAYSFFDAVLYRTFSAAQGREYQARGWTTAESQGGLGSRIGIDPTGGTNFRAETVRWGKDWWGTDLPEFYSYLWRQLTTPVTVAEDSSVTVFLEVRCRDAVQVNAGFWDDIELLAASVEEPQPLPGSDEIHLELRVNGEVVYNQVYTVTVGSVSIQPKQTSALLRVLSRAFGA